MSLIIRRSAQRFEATTVTDEGVFSGYGSIFNVADSYGSVMMPGCFARSLAAHAADGTMPKMLWQHYSEWPIGVWTSIVEDDIGLRCEGKLILEVAQAREAHALMKAGAIDGLSIGFDFVDLEPVSPEEAAARGLDLDPNAVNPKTRMYDLTYDAALWEVSPVTFNATPGALVDDVRSVKPLPVSDDMLVLSAALARRNDLFLTLLNIRRSSI